METETQTPEVARKTDFSKTNIHCSSIGLIMTGDRGKTPEEKWLSSVSKLNDCQEKYEQTVSKTTKTAEKLKASIDYWSARSIELEIEKENPKLSVTAKSHLKNIYGYAKYGKWAACKDKGNKYTNKGKLAEQDAIELVSYVRNIRLTKNEERVDNQFLTGIPDVFLGESIYNADYILDVKSSWDIETFLSNLGKPLNSAYWWQIQGYMAITGAKVGEVVYCLVNTPQSIINSEAYRLQERMDVVTDADPAFIYEKQRLINNMTFDDMPVKDRIIRFLVERDEEAIEKVYKKVGRCREHLAEIEELHNQGVFLAKESPVEENELVEEEI